MKKITGSVTICRGRNDDYRQFKSSADWFKDAEYFTLSEEGNLLRITKHYLDVPKGAQRTKRGQFTCLSSLPLGKFAFEEDSTEDELIVYCNGNL